jgi:hypothetical protein
MTRIGIRWALPALLLASCVVPGETYLGFSTGVVGAPPPPDEVVVTQPSVAMVSGGVYVVTDPAVPYDMFQYGGAWYVYSGGYWYRSGSYRGPFAVVDVRSVPRPVVSTPPDRWKHHPHGGPPGLARRGYRGDD